MREHNKGYKWFGSQLTREVPPLIFTRKNKLCNVKFQNEVRCILVFRWFVLVMRQKINPISKLSSGTMTIPLGITATLSVLDSVTAKPRL